jgi:uncharacterized peroxidase-related enzyme
MKIQNTVLPPPLSTGKEIALRDHLGFEEPTLFLFYKESSSMEKAFAEEIALKCVNVKVHLQLISLKTSEEPVAKQYKVQQTPMAIVYDRRGRETGRAATTTEILGVVTKSGDVGRIDWAMPETPEAEKIKKLGGMESPTQLPGIMRAMSLRPEAMMGMIQMASMMHFKDGALKVQTKELIATYVSYLNQCPFCLTSHAGFLAKRGQSARDVDAVAMGDLNRALGLLPKERLLLDYVKLLTKEPWKVQDETIVALRKIGWTDAEIYEATFDISLFNFFNRMANAYGLGPAEDGWQPPKAEKK